MSHPIRMGQARASSSDRFRRFFSDSSEELWGGAAVSGSGSGTLQPSVPSWDMRLAEGWGEGDWEPTKPLLWSQPPPHPRKSFTSSTVTSPVVSSVVSALVAESTDVGESVASGGSGVSAERK